MFRLVTPDPVHAPSIGYLGQHGGCCVAAIQDRKCRLVVERWRELVGGGGGPGRGGGGVVLQLFEVSEAKKVSLQFIICVIFGY